MTAILLCCRSFLVFILVAKAIVVRIRKSQVQVLLGPQTIKSKFMRNLKTKRDLILLSLIIKGVLVYSSILAFGFIVILADSLSSSTVIALTMALGAVVYLLSKWMTISDFKRIFFLSRQERKEFDTETV